MHFEVAWVVASLGTQAQPKIILEPGYLPDHLSVSYDCFYPICRLFKISHASVLWESHSITNICLKQFRNFIKELKNYKTV